ncbi:MAG TPA: GtrA family protein [Bryobacteraceae bacterium]|jgi:putative flippase GtrA
MRVIRFLGAGFLTALLDNGIFFVLHRATGVRFLSLAVSTLVSVAFNYLVVRRLVFEANVDHKSALPKYLGVHAAGLLARYGILEGIIAAFHIGPKHWGIYAAKLAADGVVYSLKYIIQRDFVFRAAPAAIRTEAPESDRSGSPAEPESTPPVSQLRPELRS